MDQSLQGLRRAARTCRDLEFTAATPEGKDVLGGLAEEYERKALTLEQTQVLPPRHRRAFKWPLQ